MVAAYAFPVDRLVQQLKFSGRLPLGRVLGTLLADRVRQDGSALPQLLLPVPLHPARERQRGFNQARVVADTTGRALQLPVDAATLQRRRNTPAQSGLDLAARQRNLQAAFRVCGPLPSHVALVDDVITTGSTVLAIAGILRQHGVRRVDAWAVARTL
ncbi:MAG: ComF family protein [Pseudomonadota bacterium]